MTEARTPYTYDRLPAKARELLPQIGPTAYAVLGCLCAFADRDGKCWPSLATLCNMMGVTKPTLCRALADLERYRLIARERQKANTNTRYKIAFPPCDSPGRVVTLTTPASNASFTPGCNASVTWGVTPAIHEPYSLNQTKEPTSAAGAAGDVREAKKKTSPKATFDLDAIPEDLRRDGFVEAWADWLAYRRQRKPAICQAQLATIFQEVREIGPAQAALKMRKAISAGWQGWNFKNGSGGKTMTGAAPSPAYPAAKPPRVGVRTRAK